MFLKYIEKGWAVLPCKNKIPLTAHGYKDASTDPDQVKKVFSGIKSPNIGIATGKISNIFVVDIDVKNDAGGEQSLKELISEFGELPHTVQAKTWSGGSHYLFNYVEKIGCKTGIRPGIDIRGDGGYIVAPPSVIDGKAYEWVYSPFETAIADAPNWLLNLLKEKQPEPDLTDKATKITVNRNETLMKSGVKMAKMGVEYQHIYEYLIRINATRCVPPLPEKEIQTIAHSVARYEVAKPLTDPLTDVWNANLFIEKHGDDIRFCDALGGWFIWDGTRWKKDDSYQIISKAKETVKQMFQRATANEDKTLFKHAIKCEAESKLKAMISLSKCENITIKSHHLDQDKFLLNCINGTLNLETGELRQPSRADNITRRVEIEYKKEAQCPEWLKFLNSILQNDQDLLKFLQKAVGYSLSGSIKEQCIFILYGTGMNGKSTFLKHIYRILGDYAINTPASTLMEKYSDGIPNDVARLKGARLVTAVESGKNRSFAEAQIKQLTGDDPISARYLHCEYFDFFATFKIFFATNHKPQITGTDKGIWRRIRAIPFEKVVSAEEYDAKLDEKLAAEYEGILAWAVEGFRLWKKEGLGVTARISAASQKYQEDSDLIGNFISETCFINAEYSASSQDILAELQEWCKEGGFRAVKRTEFIDYMERRGFVRKKGTTGTVWTGIGIKDEKDLYQQDWNENERPF